MKDVLLIIIAPPLIAILAGFIIPLALMGLLVAAFEGVRGKVNANRSISNQH